MTTVPNPIARRRELGALLREYRERRGLTLAEVADEVLCSTAKMSRIENGLRPPTARDMRDLLNLYEITDGEGRRRLNDLASMAREREIGDLNAHPLLAHYVSYEVDAILIRDYKGATIPGLLQTEDYARAVFQSFLFSTEPLMLTRLVNSRMERQRAAFGRVDPPEVHAVLDEAAIRRVVGGRTVMREQLEYLLEMAQRPTIKVQVVPFEAGSHPGMENTFTIFELDSEAGTQMVAFAEDVIGTVQLERVSDLQNALLIFEKTLEQALPVQESGDLIREAMQQLS